MAVSQSAKFYLDRMLILQDILGKLGDTMLSDPEDMPKGPLRRAFKLLAYEVCTFYKGDHYMKSANKYLDALQRKLRNDYVELRQLYFQRIRRHVSTGGEYVIDAEIEETVKIFQCNISTTENEDANRDVEDEEREVMQDAEDIDSSKSEISNTALTTGKTDQSVITLSPLAIQKFERCRNAQDLILLLSRAITEQSLDSETRPTTQEVPIMSLEETIRIVNAGADRLSINNRGHNHYKLDWNTTYFEDVDDHAKDCIALKKGIAILTSELMKLGHKVRKSACINETISAVPPRMSQELEDNVPRRFFGSIYFADEKKLGYHTAWRKKSGLRVEVMNMEKMIRAEKKKELRRRDGSMRRFCGDDLELGDIVESVSKLAISDLDDDKMEE